MNGRALVAWNLRRLRSARDVSQERLAGEAEVDRTYVSMLEREEASATVDMLDRLAQALKVELTEFFIRPPEGAAPPEPLRAGRRPKSR
ncbi:MAG: helix-turn-helix transcriptional regulator [Phenylobacterium sp.]|uniref:helix-turn-helix domain-containing protein n=1 Tax=Phenylobacterium sp. TaxID=1871053 RepID=UPI001A1FDD02|nr:helix-turn-helix transcriptional regulator [Phenylobacterium sp.]MBJ7408806.1 helix-turn-helix transcriptional regulator [Phenylobacterium sp.]